MKSQISRRGEGSTSVVAIIAILVIVLLAVYFIFFRGGSAADQPTGGTDINVQLPGGETAPTGSR